VLTLSRLEPIGTHAMPYLNRLSDALFVMARFENNQRGVAEPLWDEKA
jgi:cob(I)alamin adenosyltransferase